MAATETEKDRVRDQVAQRLLQTPFSCSSLRLLSGGTANYVYRGSLAESADSVIVKHTTDHYAPNPNINLDPMRSHFERTILQALTGLPPYTGDNITVRTPRLLHVDRETNTQVLTDLPNSLDLKTFLLSEVSHGVSESAARALGRGLGTWLRSFHDWAAATEQAEHSAVFDRNGSMKDLKFYVNYTMLIDTIPNFPQILGESHDVLKEVRDLAAAELKEPGESEGYGIIHGDFWTGNILLPNAPLTGQSATTVFVIDWEMCQIGNRALDLGQMIAELYETKLFKKVECGLWIVEGFLEGYGALSDEMAFRTAIHVGVHLVCWGSRVPGWGSQQQIEAVVTVGRDLIVQGWKKNKAWFEGDCLRCLFGR